MGYLGLPDVFGVAVFTNSGDDCITIVPENAQAPDMTYIKAGGMLWVNGVCLRVVAVDGVSVRVSAERNQQATNATMLYNDGRDQTARFRVALEYTSRAVLFVGKPDAVAQVTAQRVDDDYVDIYYAAYHEPIDRMSRLVAINGVCLAVARCDVRETGTGELLRRLRVPVSVAQATTLSVPTTAGAATHAEANIAFSVVEELAHPHDFAAVVRNETEALDLAHSEARIAASDFWGKTVRRYYPVGGVLIDRVTGYVYATFHNTDGGIARIAAEWMSAAPRRGPCTELALYMTAPCDDDDDASVGILRKAGVKHFFYAVVPRRHLSCSADITPIEIDPAAPALVAIDRFYRAFIYSDNYGGLPHLTWMRTMDITLGLEPSLGRASMLPEGCMDFNDNLGLIDHIAQCAQATITAEKGTPGKLRVTFMQAESVVTRREARGRDGSADGSSCHEEDGEASRRQPLVVDEPRTLHDAQAFLRSLQIVHAVVYEPDTQAAWPRLFTSWELVREQALFCLPATYAHARQSAKTLFLSKLGSGDEGFIYMSGLDWHVPDVGAPKSDDILEEIVADMVRDVSPFVIVRDPREGIWWIALNVTAMSEAPVSQKHLEIFQHLAQTCTAPSLLFLHKDAATQNPKSPRLISTAYNARLPLSTVLAATVRCAMSAPESPVPIEGGAGVFLLSLIYANTHWAGKELRACLQSRFHDTDTGVLVAPLSREYVSSIELIAHVYGVTILDNNTNNT